LKGEREGIALSRPGSIRSVSRAAETSDVGADTHAISYLAGLGSSSAGYRTGQPWLVPAGVQSVVTPSGKKIAAATGHALHRSFGAGSL